MEAINKWFKAGSDYYQGVAIYASLPNKNLRILKRLNKGKNNQNMSALVAELRKAKKMPLKTEPPKKVVPLSKNPSQEQISKEMVRSQIADISAKREFEAIKLGELPAELRKKYIRARQLFYEMIELKFALNDTPIKEEKKALELILQIEERDEERDLIWAELKYWKNNKRIMPVPKDEIEGLSPEKLFLKKRSLASSISKISDRVAEKRESLEKETNGHKRLLLESSIRRSEETIHNHKVLTNRINKKL